MRLQKEYVAEELQRVSSGDSQFKRQERYEEQEKLRICTVRQEEKQKRVGS